MVTAQPHLGVDPGWASHRVLGRLGELGASAETAPGVHHALGALARAGHTYSDLVSR